MASYLGRSEVPCQTSPAAPRRCIGLAASASTPASHRWMRAANRKRAQPSSATRVVPRVQQSAAPLLQPAVVLEATANANQQSAPANSPRCYPRWMQSFVPASNSAAMDDQRKRNTRGQAQRRCRFEAEGAASATTNPGSETAPSGQTRSRRAHPGRAAGSAQVAERRAWAGGVRNRVDRGQPT